MNDSIKRAKITLCKYYEGDKGIDAVTCEYARMYNGIDLGTLNVFLKAEFPDGTKNKFAMAKTVTGDKVTAVRVMDAALSKCAGKVRAQLVLEDAGGDVALNGSIFIITLKDSIADETNTYTVVPSAISDLQRELQSALNEAEALVSELNDDVTAIETFMSGDFVNKVNGRKGTVTLTKSDVGLANVDNTADLDKPLSSAATAALSGKVDKVTGKVLSSNDYTSAEKEKLASLSNYDDSGLIAALSEKADAYDTAVSLSGKVDKVSGKVLSSNDYTSAEKEKLAALSNYDDTGVLAALSGKVDKVEGKGLSDENYTREEKIKLASLSNYDDSGLIAALSGKVGKTTTVAGNVLSGDIPAQTLTDSLVVCNNTTDIDYILGE